MMHLLLLALVIFAAVLALAVLLTVLPRLGAGGRAVSDAFCRPPLLDVALGALTIGPWAAGLASHGWRGLGVAVLAQIAATYAWIFLHELAHLPAVRGPRIVRFTNRIVGRWANHLALWLTTFGVPVLWLVRLLEIFIYPFLVWLLRFPRYNHAEWVSLSRHRFRDLVGHDLAWCLYCDWMTGTWSLGTEMLRNVESFWCPIRFDHPQKMQNCVTDFPDIDGGWVPADGTMQQVQAVLEDAYGGEGDRAWFGHPSRRPASDATVQASLDDAVREALLDHSTHPRNFREMPDATHRADGELPLCNDRVTVYVRVADGQLADVSFQGKSCPICTASASMMSTLLMGKSIADARRLCQAFRDAMTRGTLIAPGDELAVAAPLAGIHRFPTRVKCAMLPWHALVAAIERQGQGE